MELNEFHIFERQTCAQHHRRSVTGLRVGTRAREIGAAITTGRDNDLVGAEAVHRAVIEVPRHDAAADPFIIHNQVETHIFDEEFGVVFKRLLIQRVQNRMAGAVGRSSSALRGRAFAILRGHAAERALIDLTLFGPRERHSVMFQLQHRRNRFAAHIFDGILVAEPVGALYRVVEMPAPVILAHIREGGRDAALCGNGVAARREDLADTRGAQAFEGHTECCPQPGAAGAQYDDVVGVIDDFVCVCIHDDPVRGPVARTTALAEGNLDD